MERSESPEIAKVAAAVGKQITESTAVRTNLAQTVIVTTRDRAKLILSDYVQAKRTQRVNTAALSALFTLALQLVAGDFHDRFGVSGEVWQAVVTVLTIASGVIFLATIRIGRKARRRLEPDHLLDQLEGKVDAPDRVVARVPLSRPK